MSGELVARWGFGLGDPPLYLRDPEIEYLLRPSARYHYLHHDVEINRFSMRSAEFEPRKSRPDELRVMVVGDSIVAGGGRVDQKDLATERLQLRLANSLGRPVVVGNIAAGSWGPCNQLAYLKRFGLFDADIVILVLNTGDVDDVPGLEPIGGAWPSHKPILALQEPLRRGIERFIPGLATRMGWLETSKAVAPWEERAAMVQSALSELASLIQDSGARMAVIEYQTLRELASRPDESWVRLERPLRAAGLRIRSTAEGAPSFTADTALFLPGDGVHPSAAGHERLAELLESECLELLKQPDSGTPSETPSATSDISGDAEKSRH